MGAPVRALSFLRTADVIDVRVGNKNLLESEAECGEAAMDAGDLVARVDDNGLASLFVGQNRAVALERANGKDLEDHGHIVEPSAHMFA